MYCSKVHDFIGSFSNLIRCTIKAKIRIKDNLKDEKPYQILGRSIIIQITQKDILTSSLM